jgi:hypothetical protein
MGYSTGETPHFSEERDTGKWADNEDANIITEETVMPNSLPQNDRDLQGWLVNFLSVANANLDALGLTSADLVALTGDATNLGTRLNIITGMKVHFEGEIGDKDLFLKAALREAQSLVERIQATPGVSDSLKVTLGIMPGGNRRHRILPTVPAQFSSL